MKKKEHDLSSVQKRYRNARNHCKDWRTEARLCYDMVAGNQLTKTEKAELEEALRPAIIFNRIDPVVSAVVGHQINNRQEIRYIPREEGDVKVNEVLTAAASYVDDNSDAEDEMTEAFFDLAVTGMGWTETRIAYDEDPQGKIWGAERTSPLSMSWDPNSTKRNLVDARYLFQEKWWDRVEAEDRWPKIKDIDFTDVNGWADAPDIDNDIGEEHDASNAWKYENDTSRYYKEGKDEVLIVRYMYYDLVPVYVVGDNQSQKPIELDEKKFSRLKERIEEMGMTYVKQMRREYKQKFYCGETELESSDSPCKHHFPLQAMTGKRDENEGGWYGLVRAMIDPQKWSNKFFAEIQDILATNRTGGAYIEETALVDPRKAEDQWSEANPLIIVKDGALQKGRIQDRNPVQYPNGLDRLMEFAVQSIPQVTGLSMELLGLAGRDQPNVLEQSRKRAGMTILASMFDSLRRHNKMRGRVLLYYIQTYISDNRLIRIMGEDGTEQYIKLAKEPEGVQYDIIVDEAPTSPNVKQETFAILMEIIPLALNAGLPVPPELLDFMPLPSQLTEKWKEMLSNMKENPEAEKFQRMMQELEIRLKKADARETETKSLVNEAKAALDEAKKLQIKMDTKIKPYDATSQMMDRSKQ